jgi:hypothetical protein
MTIRTRWVIAAIALVAPFVCSTTISAAPKLPSTYPVIGRVLDGNGQVQYPSNLVACPIVGTTFDCTQKVVEPTGRFGFAVLKLNKTVQYHLFATVANPDPAWPCPVMNGSDIVYLSNESFDGYPDQLPKLATFTITKPLPGDCAPVKVTDDAGNPIPNAGLFVNGDPRNGVTDSDGILNVRVTPGATYEIGAFLANSDWPCPAYTSPDGQTFHFSERRTVSTDQLFAGQTFVIRHPVEAECAPPIVVPVFDDLGVQVPGATGAFFCRIENGGCTSLPYPQRDANGNLLFNINSLATDATYRIQPFVINSGWPCPYILDNGDGFHSGPNVEVTGADLIAGNVTLVVHHPVEAECAPPIVLPVFDDFGNRVGGETGAFFCRVEGGGCTALQYPGRDANGNLLFNINSLETDATYRIQPFVINSGWPCPYILDNGDGFHSGANVEVTGADLIAGNVTLVVHHPVEAECA